MGKPAHTARGVSQQQALAEAAYRLIAEKGFEGLRTRDVAERVGVNIATLHYYFPSKEDLIQGVVDYLLTQLRTVRAPEAQLETLDPLEWLQLEFSDAQYQVRSAPAIYIVLFELMLRSLRDPNLKPMLQQMNAHWKERIAEYISAGVQEGTFRQDLDVPTAAWQLVSLITGYVFQMALNREQFPAENIYAQLESWLTEHVHTNTSRHAQHDSHTNSHRNGHSR